MMQDSKDDDKNGDKNGVNGAGGANGHDYHNDKEQEGREDNIISFADLRRREKEEKQAEEKAARQAAKAAHPPMINLPRLTKWLIIINLLIFAITEFGGRDIKIWAFMNLGFIPARFTGHADFDLFINALSPLTHMFLHAGWLHIGMNVAMFAAFGAGVEKAFGMQRFLAYYLACGLIGAIGHALLDPASTLPVVGASGAISGLFAAILIVLQKAGALGQGKYGLWPFIALWCFISFLFAAAGGMGIGDIAWAAHLGGFLGGFALMRLKYFRV